MVLLSLVAVIDTLIKVDPNDIDNDTNLDSTLSQSTLPMNIKSYDIGKGHDIDSVRILDSVSCKNVALSDSFPQILLNGILIYDDTTIHGIG